jgi:hypothetical protein
MDKRRPFGSNNGKGVEKASSRLNNQEKAGDH